MNWNGTNLIMQIHYLNIITNTNEPSQQSSEKNQSEDPIILELNEENLEDGFGEPPENHEDELHGEFKPVKDIEWWTKEHQGTLSGFPHHITTKHNRVYQHCPQWDNHLSQYRARMREHYATDISKEDIKYLSITKSQMWRKFIGPRIG